MTQPKESRFNSNIHHNQTTAATKQWNTHFPNNTNSINLIIVSGHIKLSNKSLNATNPEKWAAGCTPIALINGAVDKNLSTIGLKIEHTGYVQLCVIKNVFVGSGLRNVIAENCYHLRNHGTPDN